MKIRSKKKIKRKILAFILVLGYIIPQNLSMPVVGATKSDYNAESFWYYPWGKSVVHHGVDVFAKSGTRINSSTAGIVLFKGKLGLGGNTVLILGPKWRFHYYAHLESCTISVFSLVNKNTQIATVGNSGNAAGKPPHLHYSISTIIPYPWRWDNDNLGWKKMFYLNPIDYFK